MHKCLLALLLGHIVICSQSIAAQDKAVDRLTWRTIDWPPFYILNAENKGQGIYDQVIDKISDGLVDYRHYRLQMNTIRALKLLKAGKKVCHPSTIKNPKSQTYLQLSLVNSILLPHRIIIRADKAALLPKGKSISLAALFKMTSLRIGVSESSYTEKINQIINQHKQSANVLINNNYDVLITLLLNNRLDAIIQYPVVFSYRAKDTAKKDEFVNYAIEEEADNKYIPVYIACPNNAWGKKLISKINQLLIEESQTENFFHSRLRWYSREEKETLRQLYEKYYFIDKVTPK